MGRKRVFPPKIHRNKGRDRVYWVGRWHDLGPEGSAAARAEYARLVSLWAADPFAAARPAGELTVDELLDHYAAAAPYPPDKRSQVGTALLLLSDARGPDPAADFGPAEFERWRAGVAALKGEDEETPLYSDTYVRMLAGAVLRVWRWGVKTGRLPADRWDRLRAADPLPPGIARPPREVPAADPAAVAACLPHLRPPTRAMVELQLLTGARPSELFRLTPAQVRRAGRADLPGAGPIDLDEAGVWVVAPERHKTQGRGKPRWLVLGPRARAVLAPFLDRPADAPCFSPREAGGRGGRPGERYTRNTYRQAVRRACDRAGVAPWNPYQLRHAHAVEVDTAFGLDHVQAALGHANPQTSRRYAKRSLAKAVEVARELG